MQNRGVLRGHLEGFDFNTNQISPKNIGPEGLLL